MALLVVATIRFLVPLTIIRYPLLGGILAVVADNLDVVIEDFMGVMDFSSYHFQDKIFDTYMYLLMGYVIWRDWKGFAKKVGLGMLAYRLVGTVWFEISRNYLLLFIFPNVFEFFYFYYLFYKKIFKREPFGRVWTSLFTMLILLELKLIQEFVLHVAHVPTWTIIREKISILF